MPVIGFLNSRDARRVRTQAFVQARVIVIFVIDRRLCFAVLRETLCRLLPTSLA
jgi:hypothetical protein